MSGVDVFVRVRVLRRIFAFTKKKRKIFRKNCVCLMWLRVIKGRGRSPQIYLSLPSPLSAGCAHRCRAKATSCERIPPRNEKLLIAKQRWILSRNESFWFYTFLKGSSRDRPEIISWKEENFVQRNVDVPRTISSQRREEFCTTEPPTFSRQKRKLWRWRSSLRFFFRQTAILPHSCTARSKGCGYSLSRKRRRPCALRSPPYSQYTVYV